MKGEDHFAPYYDSGWWVLHWSRVILSKFLTDTLMGARVDPMNQDSDAPAAVVHGEAQALRQRFL